MTRRARLAGTAIVATAAFTALLSSPPVAAADGLPVVGINARPLSATHERRVRDISLLKEATA